MRAHVTDAKRGVAGIERAVDDMIGNAVEVGANALAAIIVAGAVYLLDNKKGRR